MHSHPTIKANDELIDEQSPLNWFLVCKHCFWSYRPDDFSDWLGFRCRSLWQY